MRTPISPVPDDTTFLHPLFLLQHIYTTVDSWARIKRVSRDDHAIHVSDAFSFSSLRQLFTMVYWATNDAMFRPIVQLNCRVNTNFGSRFSSVWKTGPRADSRECLEVFNPTVNVRIHRQLSCRYWSQGVRNVNDIRVTLDFTAVYLSVLFSRSMKCQRYTW